MAALIHFFKWITFLGISKELYLCRSWNQIEIPLALECLHLSSHVLSLLVPSVSSSLRRLMAFELQNVFLPGLGVFMSLGGKLSSHSSSGSCQLLVTQLLV